MSFTCGGHVRDHDDVTDGYRFRENETWGYPFDVREARMISVETDSGCGAGCTRGRHARDHDDVTDGYRFRGNKT